VVVARCNGTGVGASKGRDGAVTPCSVLCLAN
jgi:hypothetical protein